MERELFVYVDMAGQSVLAGRLWTRARAQARRREESATFLYDPGWLERPGRFSLEPALPLGAVRQPGGLGARSLGARADASSMAAGACIRRYCRGTASSWSTDGQCSCSTASIAP